MSNQCADFDYPPRSYKNVVELGFPENKDITQANISLLKKVHANVHLSTHGSQIVEFFNGKSVFVTGGTGFLGKLLIEKLLRTCSNIETVYMLVRPKKGKSVEDRIDEYFSDAIFSELEKSQNKFKHKIVPIRGDASLPGLGIDILDRQTLIEKVNVIFHVAATVRFDEKLRLAVSVNVAATKEIMLLARECKHMSSLLHVSTAYSQNPRKIIGEQLYRPAYLTEQILKMVETNGDEYLDKNTRSIIREWPNTYSFTKAIGEYTVQTMANGIPACIFRPAIVTSTYREPLRSWIDNLYGPMGAIVGAGVGLLRSFHADPEKVADIIPADCVVNGMIAAAYSNQFNKAGEVKIYNHISSTENPITWGDFHDLASHYGLQNPTIKSIWYFCNRMNKYQFVHLLSILFFHFIPAIFIDCYLTLMGKRRRMIQIYKKVYKFNTVLAPFSTSEWKFYNDNTRNLWKQLSETDKKLFNFSMAKTDFNWNSYLSILGGGVRLYLLKDDFSTIPDALRKYKKLYYYHKIFQGVCLLIALRIAFWILSPLISILN